MNPVDAPLADILSGVFNRVLDLDPDCQARLRPLIGDRVLVVLYPDRVPAAEEEAAAGARCLCLRLRVEEEPNLSEVAPGGPARVSLRLAVTDGKGGEDQPDIVIRVAMPELSRYWLADDRRGLAPAGMEIRGEAGKLRQWRQAVARFDPDVEELLSGYLGDLIARRLSFFMRRAWWRDRRRRFLDRLHRYRVEEAGLSPGEEELQRFARDVDHLYDRREHLYARLRALRSKTR